MRTRYLMTCVIGIFGVAMAGCPSVLGGGSSSDMQSAAGSGLGVGGADAIAAVKAVTDAEQERFPPAPADAKLCMLQFGTTNFLDAKKIFGTPKDESTDKSNAGLSYIYAGGISMYLSFDYSPKAGFGGSQDPEFWLRGVSGADSGTYDTVDQGLQTLFQSGYLLKEANVQGRPYPPCWPHSKP